MFPKKLKMILLLFNCIFSVCHKKRSDLFLELHDDDGDDDWLDAQAVLVFLGNVLKKIQ